MIKLIHVTLLAVILHHNVDCKRTKSKKLTSDTESTPKPNVLTYSTFGFNDVGSYDGFVPTSPDYATFLQGNKQESSTRLYAPAFPSNLDSSGFAENYGSSADDQAAQPDEQLQASMTKYQPGNLNFFTSPSFDGVNEPSMNKFISDSSYEHIDSDINSQIYGAKLNAKQRNKLLNELNNSEFNVSKDDISNVNAEAYIRSHGKYTDKQLYSDVNNNYPPLQKYTTTTVVPAEYENGNFKTPVSASAIKFPRVIDFTNIQNPYTPNNINNVNNNNDDISIRFPNPPIDTNALATNQFNTNTNNNYFENDANKNKPFPHLKYNNFNLKEDPQKDEKDLAKFNYLANQEFSQNYFNNKNKLKGKFSFNYDKMKKPWDFNKDENGKKIKSSVRYEYTTNHSTPIKYEHPYKRPFNNSVDEIAPASSNLDFYNYQHPESDYGNLKNYPHLKPSFIDSDNTGFANYAEKFKPLDDYHSIKNHYTTLPTVTSHWGNIFKTSEFSSHKNHIRKPVYEEETDEIVHIPRRPTKDINPFGDWSQLGYKPYTHHKHLYEWPKDTRYKTEEDLLGLRNHDLTHPSYPPFKPDYHEQEEFDYKKLVDKWKQNYLKSKYKDSIREYESYASETKPIHVPVPKPYPIEVPHPVIVPVPQPYPVHVPVPKPVAVPVIREINVPIEKPVPYPVYKKVPYPIEKPVPVPVEKQVHVPIMKPYPVAVPQVRPLFHHTRPHDERDPDSEDDDEYQPRPEGSKRIPNAKRPKKRQQPRRPSRMTYQDRDKRRGPQRRPPPREQRYRHSQNEHRRPQRYHDNDYEEYEPDYAYCKRTGNC
ncbi:unnamed protein product [Leptosia nina]|uniref:Uncharacterized protein n=1 Tax=Leptosia nina TaxID=320188 RepID=A0AAV1JW64_9NEOP